MSRDDRLRKIDDGQAAASIESLVGHYISNKITQEVTKLVQGWRAGDLPHDRMIGIIGGISALESMVADLQSIQRQAYTAAQKEFGDGS